MTLSGGMGKTNKIANLTEPIRIVLPNNLPQPEPDSFKGYCTLMLDVHWIDAKVILYDSK